MRVGHLTECYKPFINGVTHFISLHKQVLESWGHRVFVFTLGFEDYEDDELHVIRSPAIPLSDTGYHLSFRFSRRARAKIRTMDVLHVHHPFICGRQALSMGKRYDIPLVFTNHTRYHLQARYVPVVPETLTRAFLEAYLPAFTNQCALVVVPSEGVKRDLREIGVTCPLEVIPNGIDVAQFRHPAAPFSKDRLGLPAEASVAITISRLGPEKNLPFLLRALARVAGQVPHLHLVILGEGPERAGLEEMARALGLAGRLHLVGAVPYADVPNWLAMADFFVFAGVEESHPLAVLEGLAAGLPVLGIPCAGVEDTIVDGRNGLWGPEEVEGYAALMQRLATEPDLRGRLSAGAHRSSARFDIHRTSARLMTHYEWLVEARRRRQAETHTG